MSNLETKITHLLDAAGVAYRRLPHTKPVFTVEEAAAQRGVVLEEMVKSILLQEKSQPRRYVMACLVGSDRLDPQAVRDYLARSGEWKRLTFASADEIKAVTGYTQGAVAPLGLPAAIPVIFDEAIARCEKVNISSGHLELGLELAQADLTRLAGAQFAPITALRSDG
jgi:prolyl-tRNA editing enzyme YbaK/EbsC (Cys-tRNA(Pro) deacylase)